MGQEDTRKIEISADLYRRLEEAVAANDDFADVPSYVSFVLEQVLKEDKPDDAYSEEEEEVIKKRLEDLGYL